MKFQLTFFLAGLTAFTSCSDSKDTTIPDDLVPPTNVEVERTGTNSVTVTWADMSTGEKGFEVLVRNASEATFNTVAEVGSNVTEAVLTDVLVEGESYFVGVRAFNAKEQTRIISVLYKMEVLADLPHAAVSTLSSGTNCISATYTITNIAGFNNVEWGLCWNATSVPTINDAHMAGPELGKNGNVFQVIPDAMLDFNVKYNVRAYVKTATGVYYSDKGQASMSTDYPAITLTWNKLSTPTLPSEIEVYETTSKLNGDAFHAWYAIADVTGNVELRVNVPASAQTIDDQSKSFNGDCYVMVNGGYFYNGRNTGLSVVNGAASGSISEVRGSLIASDAEYNEMYYVTRGCFGVDASGKATAYWASTDSKGVPSFYTSPLPTVKGENKYAGTTSTVPVTPTAWSPKYALSAGPMLVMDGKIPFDFTTTPQGNDFFLSNYEVMPYDIFGPTVTPDRTAAGVRADGKVILFICDGRIADSDGANLLELAQIMKGLGCTHAVNFDGGGSTGMMVGSTHINDITPNNRPVVSTLGFFKK